MSLKNDKKSRLNKPNSKRIFQFSNQINIQKPAPNHLNSSPNLTGKIHRKTTGSKNLSTSQKFII